MSGTKPFYSIRRVPQAAAAAAVGGAQAAASAEIWIYADIGESWWGETISAKDLVKDIAAMDVAQITVRVNSYGGSVSDGIAIYNALKRHPASVTVCVDGIAASIASLIAMAGDRVEIAENAQMMIHAPWGAVVGNAVELRASADMLDKWAESMAASYARKSGRPEADVMAWLDGKDHWFTAAEAVAEGLADEAVVAMPVAASATRFSWLPNRTQDLPPAGATQVQPAAAAVSTPGATMPQPQNTAAPDNTAANDAQAAAQAAARAENQRQADIRAALKPYHGKVDGVAEIEAAALADINASVDATKLKVLEAMGKDATPAGGHYVVTTQDETDKRRAGMKAALLIRAGLENNDGANPFRGHTLGEVARMCLAQAGVRDVPGDKLGMIALAFTHSNSDFPLLLANVANKAMMKGYEEADETFQMWTTAGSLPDFKVQSTVDLGSFPALRKVGEGAEYKFITIGERREQRVLATYGEMFTISRQAVINDDMDAFSRLPRKMGRAAIRTVGDLAYSVLTGNANMADGIALFHASHNNLQGAGAISTATVDAMRVAMARQKETGQTTGSLNIRLAKLIVPVSLEGVAKTAILSEYEVGASTRNNTTPNSVRGIAEVISDARLDDSSTSIWYGAANPQVNDTVVVDYLDGVQTPTLEQQAGWSIDGATFKVRIDASAKALDWKTLQRNG
jgi:ATP-dependent Clp endopeptidase proteolytic subunit ClpP